MSGVVSGISMIVMVVSQKPRSSQTTKQKVSVRPSVGGAV